MRTISNDYRQDANGFYYEDEAKTLTLSHNLRKLKIACPSIDNFRDWRLWLPSLASFARTKNIREARRESLERFKN